MIQKYGILWGIFFSIIALQRLEAQHFTGTWDYKGHTFLYQLQPAEKGDRLVIRTTQTHPNQAPTSHIVYSTSVFTKLDGGNLRAVKILGAIQEGYIWSAMLDEYLRADFQANKVNYIIKGEMMTKPENQAKVPETILFQTYSGQTSTQNLIESVIRRFIAQYYPSFAVIGNPPQPKTKLTGELKVQNQHYTYEIKTDTYGKNKGVLKIRRKGKGLAFESMINLADKNAIKIHLAKPQGWAWAIYESDYERIFFGTQEATFERTGRALTIGKPTQSTLKTSRGDNLSRAVQHFIERYGEIFNP